MVAFNHENKPTKLKHYINFVGSQFSWVPWTTKISHHKIFRPQKFLHIWYVFDTLHVSRGKHWILTKQVVLTNNLHVPSTHCYMCIHVCVGIHVHVLQLTWILNCTLCMISSLHEAHQLQTFFLALDLLNKACRKGAHTIPYPSFPPAISTLLNYLCTTFKNTIKIKQVTFLLFGIHAYAKENNVGTTKIQANKQMYMRTCKFDTCITLKKFFSQ